MCGIVGFFDSGRELLANTNLSHRGPDETFDWNSNGLCVKFHRLSIVGLEGEQPFSSKCGKWNVWCNGEIFNFKDLAKEYNISIGDCDISVIPDLIEICGVSKALSLLRGFFAIVAFNSIDNEIIMSVDHFGIKPLYYSLSSSGLAFSSELRSFKFTKFSKLGLKQFFETGGSIAPVTLIDSVSSLKPGEFISYNLKTSKCVKKSFWKLDFKKSKSFEKGLEHFLKQAMERNNISDYPIANLLSGGVDSTYIALNTKGIKKNYFFDFGKLKGTKEKSNINKLSKLLNIEVLSLNNLNFLDEFDDYIKASDELVFDYAGFIYFLMMRKINQTNTRVVLNGTGGDELFFGYYRYNYLPKWKNILGVLVNKTPLFNGYDFLKKGFWNSFSKKRFKLDISSNKFDKQSDYFRYLDFTYYLPSILLKYTDRISSYFGIESRVPFLDVDLVEYIFYSGLKPKKIGYKDQLIRLIDKKINSLDFEFKEGLGLPVDKLITDLDLSSIILPKILSSKIIDDIPIDSLLTKKINSRIIKWRLMAVYSLVIWHEYQEV